MSRIERAKIAPADLRKLRRWAAILQIPQNLLWFNAHDEGERKLVSAADSISAAPHPRASSEAVALAQDVLGDAPWRRLADSLAGRRPADAATVSMIESRTAEFFRSEELLPARVLLMPLRAHRQALQDVLDITQDDFLQKRLLVVLGETEALTGWVMFELHRADDAVRFYRTALRTAEQAGDQTLAAGVFGYWSYLLSSRGDKTEAVQMLDSASERVRGCSASTEAWILARRAEEKAGLGESQAALRSLDRAVAVYDYAQTDNPRAWMSFFTPSRLGSFAVSALTQIGHREADHAANALLTSLPITENKVKALVLADLAILASKHKEFDRVELLGGRSAHVALRLESRLAIERLWHLVDGLALNSCRFRNQLAQRLMRRKTNGFQQPTRIDMAHCRP